MKRPEQRDGPTQEWNLEDSTVVPVQDGGFDAVRLDPVRKRPKSLLDRVLSDEANATGCVLEAS